MGKWISFGVYNNLYKYIWLYLIFRLLYVYIFQYKTIPLELKFFTLESFPNYHIFTGSFFEYISMFLFSFLLHRYELYQLRKEEYRNSIANSKVSKTGSSGAFTLIQMKINNEKLLSKYFYLLIITLVLANIIMSSYYNCYLEGADFWELELLLISLVNTMIFGIQIYRHQILAIYFVIISCSILKIISLIDIFKNDEEKLYKVYIWVIPIAIIGFIFAEFLKSYAYCKARYYFNLKFISISRFMKFYGLLGSIICLLGSIISTYTECTSYYDNKNIKYVCRIYETSHNYFDNFKIYFDRFWNKETTSENVKYVFLFILKNLFICTTNFFTFCIIKHLGPEYTVCANTFYYLIIEILKGIGYLISHENEFEKYKTISEIFSIIGSGIYLEFIELNFCKLNYNSKKNIAFRSFSEASELSLIEEGREKIESRRKSKKIEYDPDDSIIIN